MHIYIYIYICIHIYIYIIYVATGQKPVTPVNIPIPTKIGSKMGGTPTNQNGTIGFDNHSHVYVVVFVGSL